MYASVDGVSNYADLAKAAYELGKKEKWSTKKTFEMLSKP
jgi:hypothetical protein